MRSSILLMALILLISSCEKEYAPVTFEYTNLNDAVLTYQNPIPLDLDKDGEADFNATTRLISYNNTGDHLQYIVSSVEMNRLMIQEEEQPKMLSQDETISTNASASYEWTAIGTALLVEQIIPIDISQNYWQGTWKDQQNKYLPVQLVKEGGKIYNGWIRISFKEGNPNRIVLHDAAVSKTAGATVKAGEK
jgi:hypothetical protein